MIGPNKNRYCKYCGRHIDDDSIFCPHCGRNQNWEYGNIHKENIKTLAIDCHKKIKSYMNKFSAKFITKFRKHNVPNKHLIILKKYIRILFISVLWLSALSLIVLIWLWFYGYHKTTTWKLEDESRAYLGFENIKVADSIARELFDEHIYKQHCFDPFSLSCDYNHIELGLRLLRNAAEKGDKNAQFTLGCIYDGSQYGGNRSYCASTITLLNTDPDYARAAYWYNQSAMQGNTSAMICLANLYRYGYGVMKDCVKATELMFNAALKGDGNAQLYYGDMFRDGEIWVNVIADSVTGSTIAINAKPNINIAKGWWQKALANGNIYAKERLEKIYPEEGVQFTMYSSILGDYLYEPEDITLAFDVYGRPNGIGTATFNDGRIFHGRFVDGHLDGDSCSFTYPNGDHFEGSFKKDEFHKGKYTIKKDGSYYIGTFQNGQPKDGKWYGL